MTPALEVNAETLAQLRRKVDEAKMQGKHMIELCGQYVLTDYAAYVVHYYRRYGLHDRVK